MEITLRSSPVNHFFVQTPVSGRRLVFLVGFMGAGKSAVGQTLAHQLDWDFEDLDDRIVAREGRPIGEIFRDSGEPEFRRAEHAALRALLAERRANPLVVALGGGAFVQAENAQLLAQAAATTVFLDASVEVLFQRCQQEQNVERPLRRSREEFEQLYEARRPHYLRAGVRIETSGQDIETVAQTIARVLELQPNLSSQGDTL